MEQTAGQNPGDPPVENADNKYTEQSRIKSQQDYKLKLCNGYKQLGETIYSIIWNQCDDSMKAQLK